MISCNRDDVLNMDQGRVQYIQSESPDAHQQKSPLPRPHSTNLRMGVSYEDDEQAQLSDAGPHGSAPFSQQYGSRIAVPILVIRSSVLAVRTVAAKPNFLAVGMEGSLLALSWVLMLKTCPCEVFFDRGFWFMIPRATLSCVGFLLSLFFGQALSRHIMNGRRRMCSSIWLPILV